MVFDLVVEPAHDPADEPADHRHPTLDVGGGAELAQLERLVSLGVGTVDELDRVGAVGELEHHREGEAHQPGCGEIEEEDSPPRMEKEGDDAWERRTWRSRMHTLDDGQVYIQPLALKNCMAEVAKFLSKKIPGKRNNTYTKHFEAGVLVFEPLLLVDGKGKPIMADDVQPLELFVPSDGQRGGGRRVTRIFPKIDEWMSAGTIYVSDETITEDVLREHLDEAGKFIGMGSLRVRNNGIFGRFQVVDWAWASM